MRFWSYESLFWTILYRWRSVFQWARVRFFCFWATMLDKETWRKDCWSIPILHMFSCLVPIHSKMWIQQQTSCLHQRLVFTRIVPVLRWVLFVRQIFVSPQSEFEQHMYSSDPRPHTVSLMQLESRRAVPQASQPPSKASARTFNSTPRWPRSEKPLQTSLYICFIFLFFNRRPGSCQPICGTIIANKSFSSAKVALVCSFRAGGKNRRHVGCRNVMRSK